MRAGSILDTHIHTHWASSVYILSRNRSLVQYHSFMSLAVRVSYVRKRECFESPSGKEKEVHLLLF